MSVITDIVSLEPGQLWEGYEVDASALGVGTLRFHGYQRLGPIFWQGQEFAPWPVEGRGFARTSDRPPTPTLSVGDKEGAISVLCMFYDDMVGAKLTRHRTLARYLDAANFPGGNPTADPNEYMSPEVWYIERKSGEEEDKVMFELVGADLGGLKLPARQIICNHCPWRYRGPECGYTGPPVATVYDIPTSNPALDNCSRSITGCKLRFGEDGQLPHGGFPAAGLMRT